MQWWFYGGGTVGHKLSGKFDIFVINITNYLFSANLLQFPQSRSLTFLFSFGLFLCIGVQVSAALFACGHGA